MIRLIFDFVPTCLRVALVENEELVEFNIEHASMRGIVGNIYKGRVEKVVDTMHCAFVNIGLERNGFYDLFHSALINIPNYASH